MILSPSIAFVSLKNSQTLTTKSLHIATNSVRLTRLSFVDSKSTFSDKVYTDAGPIKGKNVYFFNTARM